MELAETHAVLISICCVLSSFGIERAAGVFSSKVLLFATCTLSSHCMLQDPLQTLVDKNLQPVSRPVRSCPRVICIDYAQPLYSVEYLEFLLSFLLSFISRVYPQL